MAQKNEHPIYTMVSALIISLKDIPSLEPSKPGSPTQEEFTFAQIVYDCLMSVTNSIKKLATGIKEDFLIPYTRQHGDKGNERVNGFGVLRIALTTENGWKATHKEDVQPEFDPAMLPELIRWLRKNKLGHVVVETVDAKQYPSICKRIPRKLRKAVELEPKISTRWDRRIIKDKICSQCRAKISKDDKMCPKCGTAASEASATKRPAPKKRKPSASAKRSTKAKIIGKREQLSLIS